MSERIALFGGTFDPIHLGHLIPARHAAETLRLDRVVLIPSANPPHKQARSFVDAHHRLEMARLAVAGEPLFEVSDCETHRSGPSFTVDTVNHFRRSCRPDTLLCWLIGADSLAELATWYHVETLVDSCQVITMARPGWEEVDLQPLRERLSARSLAALRDGRMDTPQIDISATQVRQRLQAGLSIRYLVPEPVRAYIERTGLYRSGP